MSVITCYSNWCYIDQLDGVDLKDGEEVIVAWPDGDHEKLAVKLVCRERGYSDHGHTYTMPDSRAHYETNYKGAPVLVPLVGLEAWRVK